MSDYLLVMVGAFWLGILTAISPCPLASNIAAVSFIARKVENLKLSFLSGLLYSFGRMLAYITIGLLITSSFFAIPSLSFFLQKYMNIILGPLLVLVGMFLLNLIELNFLNFSVGAKWRNKFENAGLWGALPLGILFALAFCPVSAALFFGSLIPLSIKSQSTLMIPALYGFGTAFPVLLFAFVMALGTKFVGSLFKKISMIEKWSRLITGFLILGIGIYFCLSYLLGNK
jgi:cytochrome c-type biogenesis protein